MSVEGRDLVDLGLRQAHFLRQRSQVACRQVTVAILNLMQVLDEQITAPGFIPQQIPNLFQSGWINLATLGGSPGPLLARARVTALDS
jgi:hypothetical protein